MVRLQFVFWRGAVALGLSLAGISGGYVLGTPSAPDVEAGLERSAPGRVAHTWSTGAKPMRAALSRRHASRSTPVAARISAWNQGDLLR